MRGAQKDFGRGVRVERRRHLPGEYPPREVVDDSTKVSTTSIEQPNQRSVDMPDLVGTGSSNTDFRTAWVNASTRPSPVVASYEPIPGGW